MAINYAAQSTLDSQDKSCCSQHSLHTLLGEKRSLTRLSHIRTSPSWLVARQLAFFLFHLTCEAPAAKQNQGKKAVALNTFRTEELIQGSWIMSSGWIRTELFKLLWLHQLHNERENEAKKNKWINTWEQDQSHLIEEIISLGEKRKTFRLPE